MVALGWRIGMICNAQPLDVIKKRVCEGYYGEDACLWGSQGDKAAFTGEANFITKHSWVC